MARAARAPGSTVAAALDPVARVAVDVSLPHLDRPFDYLVPDSLADRVLSGQPGAGALCRTARRRLRPRTRTCLRARGPTRVHRAVGVTRGRAHRRDQPIGPRRRRSLGRQRGRRAPPRRPASPRAGRDPNGEVARHRAPVAPNKADDEVWASYAAADTFLSALRAGQAPRAVWPAMPGPDWPTAVGALVARHARGRSRCGRGRARSPRRRSGRRRASPRLGPGHHVVLAADVGPAERYRRFLALSRGEVAAVVGTRAAAFAPVRDLGLVLIWDDGDDLHAEPRAPYWHARDVLVLRAHLAGRGGRRRRARGHGRGCSVGLDRVGEVAGRASPRPARRRGAGRGG